MAERNELNGAIGELLTTHGVLLRLILDNDDHGSNNQKILACAREYWHDLADVRAAHATIEHVGGWGFEITPTD
jgi:hypothetical protein